MKKATILFGLTLSGLVLATMGTSALAESTETTGKVEFKTQDDTSEGNVTKPGTDEEVIEPEGGSKTKGPLRLTHVPAFEFSKVDIASHTTFNNAVMAKYRDQGAEASSAAKDISHFVQVEDVRGENKGWEVKVASTKFIPADSQFDTLENTHVVLQQGKLYNSRLDATELATAVDGFKPGMAISNNKQGLSFLKTKAGQDTDSSKTTLIFNDAYTAELPAAGGVTKEGANFNPGVQLEVVGTDKKVKDVAYTATLTWSIQDAL